MNRNALAAGTLLGAALLTLGTACAHADSLSLHSEKAGSIYSPDPNDKRQEIVIYRPVQPRVAYRPLNPNNQTVGVNISPEVGKGTAMIAPEVVNDTLLAAGSTGHGTGSVSGQNLSGMIGSGLANVMAQDNTGLAPGGSGGGAGTGLAGISGLVNGALAPLGHLPH